MLSSTPQWDSLYPLNNSLIYSCCIQLRKLCCLNRPVHTTKFLEDQFRIISGSNDKTVRVWDIPTEKEIHVYQEHQVSVVFLIKKNVAAGTANLLTIVISNY